MRDRVWFLRGRFSFGRTTVALALGMAGAIGLSALETPAVRAAGPFVVNDPGDANDHNPGNGFCDTDGVDGLPEVCSLRAAIQEGNAFPGTDTINFNIGGGGAQTIAPATALPTVINAQLNIDATTQPGYAGVPLITIDGQDTVVGNGLTSNQAAGGVLFAQGLIIGRFVGHGVSITGSGLTISGGVSDSYIGIDAAGADIGNSLNGVLLSGAYAAALTSSVVSFNGLSGVVIVGGQDNRVESSMIGTDATGTVDAGNGLHGVLVNGGSVQRVGSLSGTAFPCSSGCNVISGNFGRGVEIGLGASDTIVIGNVIGSDVTGSAPIANNIGVLVSGASSVTYLESNRIAHNTSMGVWIGDTTSIVGVTDQHSISSNGGLGIDVGGSGVTPNDILDADPNQQNFPSVTFVGSTMLSTTVTATIHTSPSTTMFAEYFTSPTCDASGYGEGQTYLGMTPFTTDNLGNAAMSLTLPTFFYPGVVPVGHVVTAVATSGEGTSEFSLCRPVVPCPVGDDDCDGFVDAVPSAHEGPVSTSALVDNCPGMPNNPQPNNDGNHTDTSPPKAYDDKTRPVSDALGDACDTDDDNDGRSDADEAAGTACGAFTTATNPYAPDTDGDRVIDGWECTSGFDPASSTSAPTLASCQAAGDIDADAVFDSRERCYYGTSTVMTNTDGDLLTDDCEIASVNADQSVNVIDLQQIAQHTPTGGQGYFVNMDLNKDGAVNVLDLSFAAARSVPCP